VGLNVAAGAGVPSLTFTSLSTFLIIFAVRLVNPADGPLGEHPGWNGVAATSCSTPGTAPWTISRLSAATISAHKWQRPQDRGRRQSLGRGLRDLRMHRYGNLQTTAMMLHARDLVDEVFAEMKREAAEA
jgi:hypothetical protein